MSDDHPPESLYDEAERVLRPYVEAIPPFCDSHGRNHIGVNDSGQEFCQACFDDEFSGELCREATDTVAIEVVGALWKLMRAADPRPAPSPSLIAAIFHAVHEADQKAITREDQEGCTSFYTFACGPWHKIIGLVRQLPVSEADLLPYLTPPPDVPRKASEDPRPAAVAEAWPGQMEGNARGIIRHASWSESRKVKEILALVAAAQERTEAERRVLKQDAEHNATRAEKAEARVGKLEKALGYCLDVMPGGPTYDDAYEKGMAAIAINKPEIFPNAGDVKKALAELQSERDMLRQALARGGLDLCPCRMCGFILACIPDGLPFCEECAQREARRS